MKSLVLVVLSLFTISLIQAQNCTQEDLFWMGDNPETTQTVATDCGTDCLFNGDPDQCMLDCMGAVTPLTDECIGCFSAQVDCIVGNCFAACALGIGDCAACAAANCLIPFNDCAGIVDVDGDTWTTVSDCNDNDASIYPGAPEIWYDGIDQNCDGLSDFDQDGDGEDAVEYGGIDCNDTDPYIVEGTQTWYTDIDGDGYGTTDSGQLGCVPPPNGVALDGDCDDTRDDIYPGAPGTAEGVDNDCNTIVEGDELICTGDFNGDLQVNTDDLLQLLVGFGCLVDCPQDIADGPEVNTSDMLEFLTQFGQICSD